ncbi:hypothetical protein CUMW_108130 [Citrus unshiu]|uniref:Uncharacterized protein n=1 Tax=Citrus unshiu TaxID=55188 RepID=A0A2H5P6C0_CITUN|nr:hypothetical protein CUMW_108130 [Citrus unshiu]
MPDSQALVAVPAVAMEALAIVPFDKKSKHHEIVWRQTRRPFFVLEIEALVQAVEKLGTESGKHRTCVDLKAKDKWKSLVHRARISPQKSRGKPVPQQLLDRVLAAYAFWSQLQA